MPEFVPIEHDPFAQQNQPQTSQPQLVPVDHDPFAQPTMTQKALEPITSYPQTYNEMNSSARQQMSEGVGQLAKGWSYAATPPQPGETPAQTAAGIPDIFKGIGNVAVGGMNYVTSPINAGLRTFVGKPIEENTGIPKEYPEFAASLAIPGMGLTGQAGQEAAIASKVIAPTAGKIKEAASSGYDAVRASGVKINPDATAKLAGDINTSLLDAGYRDITAPKTFNVIKELGNPSGPEIGPRISTPADVESVRRVLGKVAADPAESDAARRAIQSIDEFYKELPNTKGAVVSGDASNLSQMSQEARANYAAAMRSDKVTGTSEAADLRTAATHSGQNIDNATRQRFTSILLNPKMRRGFSEDELNQMETIVRGTSTANAARYVGNLAGGGGGIGQAAVAYMGGVLAGPLGSAGATGLGVALKKVANASTARQVGKLDEMIRSASPAGLDNVSAARVKFAADKWARTQTLAQKSPTDNVLAKLEASSRGLALALNRNLGLDTQQMFESLKSLAPASASNDQNN